VSTNVLSLVPLVTGRLDRAAERESPFEQGERSPMRLLEDFSGDIVPGLRCRKPMPGVFEGVRRLGRTGDRCGS
jgi:hypothetical protein